LKNPIKSLTFFSLAFKKLNEKKIIKHMEYLFISLNLNKSSDKNFH
jgi:hypothetical protein